MKKIFFVTLILMFIVMEKTYSENPPKLLWSQVDNQSGGCNIANAIVLDSASIYIGGSVDSFGIPDWLIEKRNLTTGATIWVVQEAISPWSDEIKSMAIDDSGIYLIGYESLTGPTRGHYEKRDLITGSAIWISTESLVTTYPKDIAVDGTGVYIAVFYLQDVYKWLIEKRSLTTGTTIWTQIYVSSISQHATGIAVDDTGVYIAGYVQQPVTNTISGRLEKRNLSDGSLIWEQTNTTSGKIVLDNTGIYITGGIGSNRTEKRDLSNGSLIWEQTTETAMPFGIVLDSAGVYIAGDQKRDLLNGSLIWALNNGSMAIGVDGMGIYVAGIDHYSESNNRWFIKKYLKLPEPSNVFGLVLSTNSLGWFWNDNSNNENGFRVKTSTDGLIRTLNANTTYLVEQNLEPNTQYVRYVVAYNSLGESNLSNSASVYTLANPPIALTAKALYRSSATIQWDNTLASRYSIERAPNSNGIPGIYSTIKNWNDSINETTYTDTGLSSETTYWYRVKSYNGDGVINIIPSNEISVYTMPTNPTNLICETISENSISWSWIDNSNSENGYLIYSSTGYKITDLPANTTFYTEQNLLSNTRYSRYITANNSSGGSSSIFYTKYTLSDVPTGLTGMEVLPGLTAVSLSWSNVGATKYSIEKALDNGGVPGEWSTITNWSNDLIATTYQNDSLTGNTTYWYRVKSYNNEGVINDVSSNQVMVYIHSTLITVQISRKQILAVGC